MSRIPSHAVEDAPEASRPLLQKIAQSSFTGCSLNLHPQMADSPAMLAAYTALRAVIAEQGTFDPKVAWALHLTTAATVGNDYMTSVDSRFARVSGWIETQIAALRTGKTTDDAKVDALTHVVMEAAANSGDVTDMTWKSAQQAGWNDEQLAEAFACLYLMLFTRYFLNYTPTDKDI
jgi:lysozyme family protein